MPVEIIPFQKAKLDIQLSIPHSVRVRMKSIPNFIPEGFDANVEIDGILYSIHDYRKRPGHEPGATITIKGLVEHLNKNTNPANAINNNIFIYHSPEEANKKKGSFLNFCLYLFNPHLRNPSNA